MNARKVVLIGAGNVATHFGQALLDQGHQLIQIYSRTLSKAAILGERWNIPATNQWSDLEKGADLYLMALNDNAFSQLPANLNFGDSLVAHTSGSIALKALDHLSTNTAVLYPLQTFSLTRKVDFSTVPLCVEGRHDQAEKWAMKWAQALSNRVEVISSPKRKALHLAAVFVNNFANHQFTIGQQLAEESGIPADLLGPLMQETAMKALEIGGAAAQTGPAIRNNQDIIAQHLKMLAEHPDFQNIYKFVSQSILDNHRND